jgi:hypothetical protein
MYNSGFSARQTAIEDVFDPRLTGAISGRPLFEERHHLLRIVMVAILEFPGFLGGEMLAVSIQKDKSWKTKMDWVPILCIDVAVVPFVDVNQNENVVALELGSYDFIGLKKRMKLVAPRAPIGPELQKDSFAVFAGQRQRVCNLLGTISRYVVNGIICRHSIACLGHAGSGQRCGEQTKNKPNPTRMSFHGWNVSAIHGSCNY